ncbi:hypothetical protein C4546_00665 [Candidatus Parcubacteria bacterium]|jgi:hypothetical protein|nr:MAG: hypothetical protein C4546_00665 [Candidatus Parcubacteria bacterium]
MAQAVNYQNELDLARFQARQQHSLQGNLGNFQNPQSAGSLDAVQANATSQPNLREAVQEQKTSGGLTGRLKQLQEIRQRRLQALSLTGTTATAVQAANFAWARQVDIWQSGLSAGVFSFDIVVSSWLFIVIWFARIISPVLPKPRGLQIVPPYTLKTMSGIGVAIAHAGTAFFAMLQYLVIFFLVAVIAWFINLPLFEKIQVIKDLASGSLSSLYELVK